MNCDNGNEEGEGASVCQEVLTGAGKAQASVSMGKGWTRQGGMERAEVEREHNKQKHSKHDVAHNNQT